MPGISGTLLFLAGSSLRSVEHQQRAFCPWRRPKLGAFFDTPSENFPLLKTMCFSNYYLPLSCFNGNLSLLEICVFSRGRKKQTEERRKEQHPLGTAQV